MRKRIIEGYKMIPPIADNSFISPAPIMRKRNVIHSRITGIADPAAKRMRPEGRLRYISDISPDTYPHNMTAFGIFMVLISKTKATVEKMSNKKGGPIDFPP